MAHQITMISPIVVQSILSYMNIRDMIRRFQSYIIIYNAILYERMWYGLTTWRFDLQQSDQEGLWKTSGW